MYKIILFFSTVGLMCLMTCWTLGSEEETKSKSSSIGSKHSTDTEASEPKRSRTNGQQHQLTTAIGQPIPPIQLQQKSLKDYLVETESKILTEADRAALDEHNRMATRITMEDEGMIASDKTEYDE